ncbi:MAG: agmatine deiminase family protein [Pirellulaceae bacterium]
MSGEFESQSGLVVPFLDYAWLRPCVENIIAATWNSIDLTLVVEDDGDYNDAVRTLDELGVPIDRIRFSISPIETPWLRDMGPLPARSNSDASVIWYDTENSHFEQAMRPRADALPRALQRGYETLRVPSGLALDGGAILSNGRGLTVVSKSVEQINQEAGFTGRLFTAEIQRITGASQIVSVQPLEEEPTGHIDLFMTFVSADTVVVAEYVNPEHPNARILDENARTLAALTVDGKPLKVVRIPMPESERFVGSEGKYIYSYTNVIFANDVLLVPSWPSQDQAIESEVVATFQNLLPSWTIKLIDCSELRGRGGALHCLTSNLGCNTAIRTGDISESH